LNLSIEDSLSQKPFALAFIEQADVYLARRSTPIRLIAQTAGYPVFALASVVTSAVFYAFALILSPTALISKDAKNKMISPLFTEAYGTLLAAKKSFRNIFRWNIPLQKKPPPDSDPIQPAPLKKQSLRSIKLISIGVATVALGAFFYYGMRPFSQKTFDCPPPTIEPESELPANVTSFPTSMALAPYVSRSLASTSPARIVETPPAPKEKASFSVHSVLWLGCAIVAMAAYLKKIPKQHKEAPLPKIPASGTSDRMEDTPSTPVKTTQPTSEALTMLMGSSWLVSENFSHPYQSALETATNYMYSDKTEVQKEVFNIFSLLIERNISNATAPALQAAKVHLKSKNTQVQKMAQSILDLLEEKKSPTKTIKLEEFSEPESKRSPHTPKEKFYKS